jgi:hypothetical protein
MVGVGGFMKSRADWGNRQGNSATCFLNFLNEISNLDRYFESHQPHPSVSSGAFQNWPVKPHAAPMLLAVDSSR